MIVSKSRPLSKCIKTKKSKEFNNKYLTLYVNNHCNLNCPFCLIPQKLNLDVSFEEIKDCLDNFNNIKSLFIMGTELSINPEISNQVLLYAKRKKIPIKFGTNGFAPTKNYESLLKGISPKDLEKVTISIDSMDEKIHNTMRNNKNSFSNAMRCMKYLKDRNYDVRVQMTVCDLNYDTIISSIKKLYKNYNIKRFGIHCMSVAGVAKSNKYDHIDPFKWRELLSQCKKLFKKLNLEELTIPIIAMNENELNKYYFNDKNKVKTYINSLMKGDKTYCPKLCPALNQDFYYLMKEKEGWFNTSCQVLSFAKNSFHSKFDTKSKKFILNESSNSEINIINNSPFLCPAIVVETMNPKGYEVDGKGDKLFYVCRHISIPFDEIED
ncbi:MAG: radical SAM protein [Candidatus Woesearchaeota archaeon]